MVNIRIPETVKIGGLTYKVEILDEIPGKDACADTQFQKQLIRIERAQDEFMQQVFIHEVLHAMNGEWAEERIEFLAMALYQFIRENPIFENSKGGVKKNG